MERLRILWIVLSAAIFFQGGESSGWANVRWSERAESRSLEFVYIPKTKHGYLIPPNSDARG